MFVRLHGLANKVVLVDEAHAYDTYTSKLLDCLIEWLEALGCSVIILSATLPGARRRALLQAYGGPDVKMPDAPYPRVTIATRGAAGKALPIRGAAEKEVLFERLQAPCAAGQETVIADRLAHELREGGCAGWICNTVDSAQLAYRCLQKLKEQKHPVFRDVELVLYHARFPVEQRREIEDEIDLKFGKKGLETGQRPRCAVLIGTQVLEQALDYPVDVMVTELAPVDLVLQRSGRLHRHPHARPAPLNKPRLLWVEPRLNDAGEPQFGISGCIYEETVLLRSWHALRHCLTVKLPGGIEELVEAVYADPPTVLPGPLQELATRLEAKADIKHHKHEGQALSNAIFGPTAEDPFKMDRLLPDEEAAADVRGFPGTRLAEPSINLVCAHQRGEEVVLTLADVRPLRLDARPDRDEEKDLLRRSVRVQNRHWVEHFQKEAIPKGWEESPVLRHHRLVVFTEGEYAAAGRVLRLHEKLGLITAVEVLCALDGEDHPH
jgi:CRISPR-associated endonuclease/helicase Cas3